MFTIEDDKSDKSDIEDPKIVPAPQNNVDDLLERTNAFGRFQLFMACLYTYANFAHLNNMQFMGFGGTKPKFLCLDDGHSGEQPTDDCGHFYNCTNLTFVYDFYSVVDEWSLVCDQSYYASLMTTIQMVGVLVGSLFAGPSADSFGRKRMFICFFALELFTGALSASCQSWPSFTAFRFFVGFCLGAAVVSGWVFVAEMTTNRYRLITRAIAGAVLAQFDQPLIAYLTKHWRWFTIIGNLQCLPLLMLVIFFTPESPRWLLEKGRGTEAEDVMRRIARFNKTTHLLPVKIFGPNSNQPKNDLKRYFAWDLFESKKMATRTLVMMVSYFSMATINFGMFFGIGDLPLNIYLSMTLLSAVGILELPVALYDAHNVKLNRKYLLIGASLLALLANIIVTILLSLGGGSLNERAYNGLVSTVSIFGQLLSMIALDIAYLYSIELFPTLLRSNAGALCSVGARLGSILAPQLLYFQQFWTPLPYCCFSVIAAVGVVVDILFLPNTKNSRLPESISSANFLD